MDALSFPTLVPAHSLSPNPGSVSHHRRVELQSPLDLLHLHSVATAAARRRIDESLPPESSLRRSTSGVDEMRAAVEAEVSRFLEETFKAVKKGVEVNGVPWDEGAAGDEGMGKLPEEVEPFDTRLAAQITALYTQIEALNLSLANTRRTAAALAAEDFRREFDDQSRTAEQELLAQEAAAKAAGGAEVEQDPLVPEAGLFNGRDEAVRDTWQQGLRSLRNTAETMDKTRESAEETVRVVEYLEGR